MVTVARQEAQPGGAWRAAMVKETIRVYARVKPLGRRQQAGVGWGDSRCAAGGEVRRLGRAGGRPWGCLKVGGSWQRECAVSSPSKRHRRPVGGEEFSRGRVGSGKPQPQTVL